MGAPLRPAPPRTHRRRLPSLRRRGCSPRRADAHRALPRPRRGGSRPRGAGAARAQRGAAAGAARIRRRTGQRSSGQPVLAPVGRRCAPRGDPAGAARDRRSLGARRGIGRAGALRRASAARPPARARVALGPGRRAARPAGLRAGRPARPPARRVRPRAAGTGLEDPVPRRRHAVGGRRVHRGRREPRSGRARELAPSGACAARGALCDRGRFSPGACGPLAERRRARTSARRRRRRARGVARRDRNSQRRT